MARTSIFVHARTPSIFKSLILKQIDLYCKNSVTNVLYIDLTLLWYYFWAIGINITWQWRHNKSNFCPYGNFESFWNALRYNFFGYLSSVVRSFTKSCKRNFEISWNFYEKEVNYAWTEGWTWYKEICCLSEVSGRFLSLIRFANDLYSGALARAKRAQQSTMGNKIGLTINPRKFGYDVPPARPPTRTHTSCKPMSNVTIDLAQLH